MATYHSELPADIPTTVSPPPTVYSPPPPTVYSPPPPSIQSPQPIPIAAQQQPQYGSYPYPSGPKDYYAPPVENTTITTDPNTGYQPYSSVPIAPVQPSSGVVVPPPNYDSEKAGTAGGKQMITIFGKQYTKKTVIIAAIIIAVVLIFIIGLGAGLGSKGKSKKKKGKSLGGGSGGYTNYDDDDYNSYGDYDYTSDGGDSGSCSSCDCYTDMALLEQCINMENDVIDDIINNIKL